MGFRKTYHADGSWSAEGYDKKNNLVRVQGYKNFVESITTIATAEDGAVGSRILIKSLLIALTLIAFFAYNLPGIMLTATVSTPAILLALFQGNGLGWIPAAVWLGVCIISMLGAIGYHNEGERRVYYPFLVFGWLASIALLVYAVHFADMTALDLLQNLKGDRIVACISQILYLQLQIIVPLLALSSLFMIFSFRITLIVSSLRMNSLLLPSLLLMPIISNLLVDEWCEVTYASVAGNLEPLLGALQLTSGDLNSWVIKLTPILAEVTIKQQLIAAGVLFVALQLIALILSFIPHRK